jgi:adenine-specific DNA-methyltransferase
MSKPGSKSSSNTADSGVSAITHTEANRKNIPSAEMQQLMEKDQQLPKKVTYERNPDLDPQLVWRGKDLTNSSDLVVNAPPLYIQEKVHPKVLIDDLKRHSQQLESGDLEDDDLQADLFADFNGLPNADAQTEFYQHDQHWSNRMILGDSLQAMASLAEREGLRGQVQCIYFDPPYGIKFNSNFQWSTTTNDVKDGNASHITREPEQVKAFRDTWRDGIHSYLTYLRDRLTVARDLLTESGSIFVQIGDENVHRVRALMDEVFGEENYLVTINYVTTSGFPSKTLSRAGDSVIWYAKDSEKTKYNKLFDSKLAGDSSSSEYKWLMTSDMQTRPLTTEEFNGIHRPPTGSRRWRFGPLTSSGASLEGTKEFNFQDKSYHPGAKNHWKVSMSGLERLAKAGLLVARKNSIAYYLYAENYPVIPRNNYWLDTKWGFNASDKRYVVETNSKVVERCLLMATSPGDLVLDPTCGSGTTAYVAEQWGRRWITLDTSRVSLALARARIMGARYPYYLLADSPEGQQKEAEITRTAKSTALARGRINLGFVYQRVPHITLKSIANNPEIDEIWDKFQPQLETLRSELNEALGTAFEEWQIPREPGFPWPEDQAKLHAKLVAMLSAADSDESITEKKLLTALKKLNEARFGKETGRYFSLDSVPENAFDLWADAGSAVNQKVIELHAQWWALRIQRQQEMDASIAARADQEYLYDKPYEDKKRVRVAGPFTVESLSPHRALGVDENDELIDPLMDQSEAYADTQTFLNIMLETLKVAGVQQAHKEDKIEFSSLEIWPGAYISAVGRVAVDENSEEQGLEQRAAIFVGPEFGTVSRADLAAAAREAADGGFDMLIACAFSFEAHTTDFNKLGYLPVLKARMNADLHMATDLKDTDKANLFVIFGEPDIDILETDNGQYQVKLHGVDVFDPSTGEVRSDNADGIACWFIDTDYNEASFFVRQAYFLGASDPYKSLKTTLKAEINEDAWQSLNSDLSRPFAKPASGRIAVKVINHLGDEVMKVFSV